MITEREHMTSGTQVETGMNEDKTTPSDKLSVDSTGARATPVEGYMIGAAIIALIVALIVVFGIIARRNSEGTLAKDTKAESVPFVNVIYPASSSTSSGLALPGKHSGLCRHADLCAYERLSEELAL